MKGFKNFIEGLAVNFLLDCVGQRRAPGCVNSVTKRVNVEGVGVKLIFSPDNTSSKGPATL